MASERDAMLDRLRARAAEVLRALPDGARRWARAERLHYLGRALARQEGADPFVVGMAALAGALPEGAAELAAAGVPRAVAGDIIAAADILRDGEERAASREALLLLDAHRLDALGALGIAELLREGAADADLYERADPFALLRPFDPERSLVEQLYARVSTLPRRMHSASARRIALRRSGIMLFYLEALRDELAETVPDALLPEADWLVPKDDR